MHKPQARSLLLLPTDVPADGGNRIGRVGRPAGVERRWCGKVSPGISNLRLVLHGSDEAVTFSDELKSFPESTVVDVKVLSL